MHLIQPLLLVYGFIIGSTSALWKDVTTVTNLLSKGDKALAEHKLQQSIDYYKEGIQLLPTEWSEGFPDDALLLPDEIQVVISLYTNYATALSYLDDYPNDNVLSAYRTACLCYRHWKKQMDGQHTNEYDVPKDIVTIVTQSYFLLGMTSQDIASTMTDEEAQQQYLQNAARAYAAATQLDPFHWSSFANMGSVLADVGLEFNLGLYEEGIMAYQKAIDILTGSGSGDDEKKKIGRPTDPPENVREVVGELHYRIGLCLVPFLFSHNPKFVGDYNEMKCTLNIGPASKPTTRSCMELSAYQFNNALQYNPAHEEANNALTMVTADAVFGMSTDPNKVKSLFEDYAKDFEHSLVDELGYNAFDRMRRGFDRAMKSKGHGDRNSFPLVVDAGCGTGLAGEVFRNISQTLVGVDLSPTIIKLAEQSRPNLYDDLRTGDIKEILREYEQKVSLLVAADTFIYFNDLNQLFTSIAAGLEEGGYAIFSLENVAIENEKRLDKLKPDWRWQLTPSGRVAHRKEYVSLTANALSLETVLYEKLDAFRRENGKDVRGHMFVLQKQAQTQTKDEL